jgi:lactoylglutathione lyase
MKLNHLNLTVTDVAETRKLFETYFGFTGFKEVGNEKFALLFGEDGFVLNLMRGAQVSYPETFHIGFTQESEEQVNEINQRLKDDGFDVNPPGNCMTLGHSIFVPLAEFLSKSCTNLKFLLEPSVCPHKKQSYQGVGRVPSIHRAAERDCPKSLVGARGVALWTTGKALFDPFRLPYDIRIHLRNVAQYLFGQSL